MNCRINRVWRTASVTGRPGFDVLNGLGHDRTPIHPVESTGIRPYVSMIIVATDHGNCVTDPRTPRSRPSFTRTFPRTCGKSLIGTALVGFGVSQHA